MNDIMVLKKPIKETFQCRYIISYLPMYTIHYVYNDIINTNWAHYYLTYIDE